MFWMYIMENACCKCAYGATYAPGKDASGNAGKWIIEHKRRER